MKAVLTLVLITLAVALTACGSSGSGESPATEGAPPGGSPPAETTPPPVGASAETCASDLVARGRILATGVSCGEARAIAAEWSRTPDCAPPAGESRFSCRVDGYRCLGVMAQRGGLVSCSRPQRSIAFVADRR